MKIYLLYSSRGEWDDYVETVEGCYLDGYTCQTICDKENNDLKILREQQGFIDYINGKDDDYDMYKYNDEYENILDINKYWVKDYDISDYKEVMRDKFISDLLL